MVKSEKISSTVSTSIVFALVILAFILGLVLQNNQEKVVQVIQNVVQEKPVYLSDNKNLAVKSIDIPAISSDNDGIPGTITVSISKGEGSVFVDVSNILVKENAEHSMRLAAEVAYNLSNKNMSEYNTHYRININSPAIEGSSAGTAMTLLTYAALENKEIKEGIIITGTIHSDKTIGPASGILEKAQAAKEIGKTLFLVPPYQATETNLTEEEVCKIYGQSEFCNNEVHSKQISIEDIVGIEVREIRTIEEAIKIAIK